MEAFGFGQEFINWIKVIYANATTRIKVNGHLTKNIPLNRGLRQGCPLSSSLYVLVIEIFALQLRKNPNIVGFRVEGEKIISLHYADDAIITIKQNKCFKEVIKDLQDYEEASGAKVNYDKTKGLWTGQWKNNIEKPMNIKWTNGNVKNLGVYFGNDKPGNKTIEEIIPKIKKSMDYWKQFKLKAFAKARIIEIFHASRLWYAASFYDVTDPQRKQLQKYFLDYINFPRAQNTVAEIEMKKLRKHGGIKLIDIETKINSYRTMWLIEILTNKNLTTHRTIMTNLIGQQKGGLQGTELFFTTKQYTKTILTTNTQFYKKAIYAITKLDVKKNIKLGN